MPSDANRKAATLVIAAHGSSRHPGARPVHRHVEALLGGGLFADVVPGFLKEPPFLADVLDAIETPDAFVVPMVTGNGYITDTLIPGIVADAECAASVHMCKPVGSHPMLSRIMAERVDGVLTGHGLARENCALLLAAHGNARNPDISETARDVAANLGRELGITSAAAFIEEAPFISDWPGLLDADNVIVMPFLIGGGFHGVTDLPVMLGLDGLDETPDTAGPFTVHGRSLWCCPAVGNEAAIADIIVDRVNSGP